MDVADLDQRLHGRPAGCMMASIEEHQKLMRCGPHEQGDGSRTALSVKSASGLEHSQQRHGRPEGALMAQGSRLVYGLPLGSDSW